MNEKKDVISQGVTGEDLKIFYKKALKSNPLSVFYDFKGKDNKSEVITGSMGSGMSFPDIK